MPRPLRITPPAVPFHVLNRGVERRRLFNEPRDYAKFVALLAESHDRYPVDYLAYCVMPNHWHLVMTGETERAISAALQWLTCRHACDLRRCEGTVGHGHVYQARFHAFPIGSSRHLLNVMRYVEGNAWRAGLVERAEEWRWGSLWDRPRGATTILGALPLALPDNWLEIVNTVPSAALVRRLQESVRSGRPYGPSQWATRLQARRKNSPPRHTLE